MSLIKKMIGAALASAAVAAPYCVHADTVECTASPPTGCTTPGVNVTVKVTIPAVLRFELGAATGSPEVRFNNITPLNLGDGSTLSADSGTNTGNADATVTYRLVSTMTANDVTIAATGTTVSGLGTAAMPWNKIVTGTGTTGAVAMPAVGSSSTVSPGGTVIDESGVWEYAYVNDTIPPAGTYEGTITYTATQNP